MKSIKNIFGLAMGVLFGLSVASCNDSVEYTPAEAVAGGQVFFGPATTNIDHYEMASGKGSFEVTIDRAVKQGDLTVALELTQKGDHKPLVAPASASFKDGESSTKVTINYDNEGMEYEELVEAVLSVKDAANTTPYGVSSYEFSAYVPAPWSPWCSTLKEWTAAGLDASAFPMKDGEGTCTFTYVAYWAGVATGLPIYYRQSLLDPTVGQFRIDKWSGYGNRTLYIDYNTETHDCHVNFQEIGAQYSNGEDIVVADLNTYNPKYSHEEYPCNYNPETGKFQLYLYYHLSLGGWDALESVQVAGYYVPDYTITAEYDGMFINKQGETFVQFTTEHGVDAKNVKAYIVGKKDDSYAVADALAAGEIEGYDVEEGVNRIPVGDATGELKIVLAVIADDEAKAVTEFGFEYYPAGNASPWQSLGVGLYTDDIVAPMFGLGVVTYPVEIMESTETPGLYRVMNPYGNSVYPYAEDDCAEEGLYLEVNACDPEGVFVELQSFGFDWGYGEFAFVSEGARYLAGGVEMDVLKSEGFMGTLKDGVITFPSITTESGMIYQGILYLGDKGYYGGNGDFKIVLPSAVPAAAKKKVAEYKHNARKFRGVKYTINNKVNKNLVRAIKPAPFK